MAKTYKLDLRGRPVTTTVTATSAVARILEPLPGDIEFRELPATGEPWPGDVPPPDEIEAKA